MKKLFALLLAVMMLATVAVAETYSDTAEGADEFLGFTVVEDKVPEGYTMTVRTQNGMIVAEFEGPEDQPTFTVTVAYSEAFEGYTLDTSELTDEEIAEMTETLAEQYNDATVSLSETAYGTDVIILNENGVTESDYAEIITIYQGYFVSVTILATDDVTDEVINDAIQLLSDLWIVPVTAE